MVELGKRKYPRRSLGPTRALWLAPGIRYQGIVELAEGRDVDCDIRSHSSLKLGVLVKFTYDGCWMRFLI